MKKTKISIFLLLFFIAVVLHAQGSSGTNIPKTDNTALKPILENFAARNFASGDITKDELDMLVFAGIRSPSARNGQPWHFTVIKNQVLAKKIISQVTDGNILILVSASGDGKTNGSVILDCGLAVQSIYLAAQAMGLGSRIYTGPVDSINKSMKAELDLPKNHNVIAVIRIGRLPANTDAVSSASTRNSINNTVTYK